MNEFILLYVVLDKYFWVGFQIPLFILNIILFIESLSSIVFNIDFPLIYWVKCFEGIDDNLIIVIFNWIKSLICNL